MAPTPEKENGEIYYTSQSCDQTQLKGDEVVISGMSGCFPKSNNLLQFMQNLYEKNDMTEEEIPEIVHPALPKRIGKIKDWDYFDAQFFRVPYMQAEAMNPATRLLLENSYCAIFDSGVNPVTLYGSKIGVYVSGALVDTTMKLYNLQDNFNFIVSGFCKAMLANRISYWIDSKGPSYSIDGNCASTLVCLEKAYNAIKSGECDSAIVGAYNCCFHPVATINMKRRGLLCSEKMKCFDEGGDGYIRSDVISVLFIQKAKDAKRIYSEVCYVKSKYFADPDGCFLYYRKPNDIEQFLEEFYSDVKVSPEEVEYIEANAAGIGKSDMQELDTIGNIFGKQKTIKVGSVKSNMGHAEGGSGSCSIIKICLAYQKGIMAANLDSGMPQKHKTTTARDRVKILTNHTKLKRGAYSAVNNFSCTGLNSHLLLKDHYKPKVLNEKCSIPHLVLVSGRQEKSADKILDSLEKNPIDVEQIALLRNIFERDIPGHTGRGYIILDCNHAKGMQNLSRHSEYYPGDKRPIWFLYSGMGSQWPKMGLDLLRIPKFENSIEKCQKVLAPFGIDLKQILTDSNESIFSNILNCFVGIAAVQIGLTDVLKELGIVPDNIIGHSVGELGCAYADGCLTAEEMILSAYYRGLVSIQTKLVKGSMAAVGLGYKTISKLCPPEIAVACHNSTVSSTISGPAESIKKFIAELTNRGIFAKEVQTANIAYHSEYIKEAGPGLLKYMNNVIKKPKLRSEKWLCTSETRERWGTAMFASAEYFTNNLLNSVYFEETARLIPSNAIVIEIAPHGLLQAIVKRSLPGCYHVPLTRRDQSDGVLFLLNAIGKLYEVGLNPKIQNMYPEVQFPVSTETPSLSHMVEWEHSEKWLTYKYLPPRRTTLIGRSISISGYDEDLKFINNYLINGQNVLPPAAILVYVWETLAIYKNINYREMSVIFQNVKFHCITDIRCEDSLKLNIEIQKGTQAFEVTNQNKILIASGKIKSVYKVDQFGTDYADTGNDIWIKGQDLYKMLRSKGYSYKSDFRSIQSINSGHNKAYVQWKHDWIAFLDGLLQLNTFSRDHNGVSFMNFINHLVIDVKNHDKCETFKMGDENCYLAHLQRELYGVTVCGGVKIEYITFIDYQTPVYNVILTDETGAELNFFTDNPTFNEKNDRQIKLYSDSTGDFDRLIWTKQIYLHAKNSIKVCFAGVSYTDCLKAAGSISHKNNYYGTDYSGIDKNGKAVMGVTSEGALSKFVSGDPDLTWPVPEHWSLEEAATVPLPYLHAYYCLTIRCQLMPGFKVFVTGGVGGLGQAIISLCLALQCEVYTTVSDEQKKQFLITMFPNLKEQNITYSRQEPQFNFESLNSERGGFDIVVNCTSGKLRKAAMNCVGFHGIFLDISEYDLKNNEDFGMSYLWEARSYKSVRLIGLFENNNIEEKKLLHKRLSDGIAQGIVRPLSRVVYSPEAVSQAFRLLSSSGHRGRVLINMTEIDSASSNLKTVPRILCNSDDVKIIVFNGNVLATEHIEYFITTGIRNFVILIRPTDITDYLRMRIALWKQKTCNIHIVLDNKNESVYKDLFNNAIIFGNIEGVYIYENTSLEENYTANIINSLNKASRQVKELRHFVVVTSGTYGSQDDFTKIQKLCAERKRLGLHALHANIIQQNPVHSFSTYFKALEINMLSNRSSITIRTELIQKSPSEYLKKISSILEHNRQEEKKTKEMYYGMNAFYNSIADDDYMASEPVVTMATQLAPTIEADVDLNPEDTYLLMIPGFEGQSHIFTSLAERLKMKALTLQLVPDYDNSSVETIARDVLKYLKDRIKVKSKFYILGYSFGALVALELANILEQEGFIGVVYCLDSSPDALRAHLDAYLGKLEEEELQNKIITHFYRLLFKCESEELIESISNVNDWQTKLKIFLKKAKQRTALSHEYLMHCLNSFYRQIILSYNYKPNLKLDSELILIKGVPHPDLTPLSEDYNLSSYTRTSVKVFNIESEHSLAPYDIRIANIIYPTLDADLRKEIETKGYCDFYYWHERN